jgi:hypothetical protein
MNEIKNKKFIGKLSIQFLCLRSIDMNLLYDLIITEKPSILYHISKRNNKDLKSIILSSFYRLEGIIGKDLYHFEKIK